MATSGESVAIGDQRRFIERVNGGEFRLADGEAGGGDNAALRKGAKLAARPARHPHEQHKPRSGDENKQDRAHAPDAGAGGDGDARGGHAKRHRNPEQDLQRIEPCAALRRGVFCLVCHQRAYLGAN
ncbi:MAG: hypothetical protein NVV62_19150 [Terricaulis sp.]|nr:hypothetical protein [Terricaulis sp.]